MVPAPPRVWRRFEKTLKDGTVKKFKIQEVPLDMYDDVMNFMKFNFLCDEPFTMASGIIDSPDDMKQLWKFWSKFILPQNLTVLCLEDRDDDEKEIVGVNFLLHEHKNDPGPGENKLPERIDKILNEVFSRFNVYEKFGVDEYLGAAGLAVNKKYRGMNIGAEILLARTPICNDRGLKITETLFTAVGSQVLAAKAGFTTFLEFEFSDLEQRLNIQFPEGFKTFKIMTKMME